MALLSGSRLIRFVLSLAIFTACIAQSAVGQEVIADSRETSGLAELSSSPHAPEAEPVSGHGSEAAIAVARRTSHGSFIHSLGFDLHTGVNGFGADVALPLAQRFNVRLGADYFRYSSHFSQDGANVDASLRLGNAKVAVDWFPLGNGFRVSPQVVLGIQTRINASVVVPSGQVITLDGQDFVSSDSDPLRGSALVSTRRSAPGLAVGWGNIAPHGERHLSFPVEVGFYYIGQPGLSVTFQGSACDPQYPQPLGCQDVTQDKDFQKSLQAFIRRNQNNLSYASFFPVASFGVGYRF